MRYKSLGMQKFFRFVTTQAFDGQTDGFVIENTALHINAAR